MYCRHISSNEGPTLETLDFAFYIGSTPTFLYFNLYLNTAYAAHYVYSRHVTALYSGNDEKQEAIIEPSPPDKDTCVAIVPYQQVQGGDFK